MVNDLENVNINEYNFSIKNYDETNINQILIYYQFKLIGIEENINYELINTKTNEKIEFENNLSEKFKLGLKKEEHDYCLIINFDQSQISKNEKINIEINTFFVKEEN